MSCVISWRAFSANSGQLEAGSTTTASSFLPSRPPLALISAMDISTVSLSTLSEMAIVPDSECSTPTLMVSAACAERDSSPLAASAAVVSLRAKRRCMDLIS